MRVALVVVTLVAIVLAGHFRLSLAETLAWQCDEVPLLSRLTGLCGHASSQAEAEHFTPSFYTFHTGAVLSLRPVKWVLSLHTTSGFWTNLSIHVFGFSSLAGRAPALFWSMAAVIATAWAAWLVSRSVWAVCFAGWLVAFSPCATAYAVQARGYAEVLALTPLLLVALEYLRRRPDRWVWAALVLVWGLQLSLAVYTMWVYWVVPAVGVSVLLWPRLTRHGESRGAPRGLLVLVAIGLCAAMVIYSVDRWPQLYRVASASEWGVRFEGPGQVWAFLGDLAVYLLPRPRWLALVGVIGLWAVWKSPVRWWLWVMGAALAVLLAFTLLNGSPGFMRNLIYLLIPVALLFGAGADGVIQWASKRANRTVVAGIAVLGMAGMSAAAYAALERDVRAIVLPDWGTAVVSVNDEPVPVGPRWFCRCMTNHWQINWYRAFEDPQMFLGVPPGGQIEVVMGAEVVEGGRPEVYRMSPAGNLVKKEGFPEYLAAWPSWSVVEGVELWRWCGTRIVGDQVATMKSDDPVLVVAAWKRRPSRPQWDQFWQRSGVYSSGAVPFKPRNDAWSFIAPSRTVRALCASVQADLGIDPQDIACFSLSQLPDA